jgi:hypothetical protein
VGLGTKVDRPIPGQGPITEQSRKFKYSFEILKTQLQVDDFFNYSQDITLSWDNRRTGPERVLARLDRIYYFSSGTSEQGAHIQTYRILGDSTLSDHLPLFFELELTPEQLASAHYKVNNAYLVNLKVITELVNKWKSYPPTL